MPEVIQSGKWERSIVLLYAHYYNKAKKENNYKELKWIAPKYLAAIKRYKSNRKYYENLQNQ